jgi:hypothetical protein
MRPASKPAEPPRKKTSIKLRVDLWRAAKFNGAEGGSEKVTDPIHLPRRLRLADKRRGEEAARQAADERSAVHHSMT